MPSKNFFSKVYKVVIQIPEGRVASYGAIANYLVSPQSARMVGWACGQRQCASRRQQHTCGIGVVGVRHHRREFISDGLLRPRSTLRLRGNQAGKQARRSIPRQLQESRC